MSLILCLETATPVCSAALAGEAGVIDIRTGSGSNDHSAQLTVFVEELMREHRFDEIAAVAVSKGPGSYTGLRIGVSVAKGLCYALGIPLISVPTLKAMADGMARQAKAESPDSLLCPMVDARRMEVYCAMYTMQNEELLRERAEIIGEDSFADFLSGREVIFFGNGSEKVRPLLSGHPNARFREGYVNSAADMVKIAAAKLVTGDFEDLAYFEPFYLKDFVAAQPRVKGL